MAYFNDFSQYTIGISPSSWTAAGDTSVTYSVSSSTGPIAISHQILTMVSTTAAPGQIYPSILGTAQTDGEIMAVVLTGTTTPAPNGNNGIAFRGQSTADAGYAVYLVNLTSASFRLDRYGIANVAEVLFDWSANTLYGIRCRFQSSHIQARVWPWSTGIEPVTWNIDTTDATYTSGFVGVDAIQTGFANQQGRICWWAFSTGTNADLPPGYLNIDLPSKEMQEGQRTVTIKSY